MKISFLPIFLYNLWINFLLKRLNLEMEDNFKLNPIVKGKYAVLFGVKFLVNDFL